MGRFRLVEAPETLLVADIGTIGQVLGVKVLKRLLVLAQIFAHEKLSARDGEKLRRENDIIFDASGSNFHLHMHPS